jgi:hypothetical protein
VAATVDDGLLEVVALTDGWHTAAIMAKATHARRLVQVTPCVPRPLIPGMHLAVEPSLIPPGVFVQCRRTRSHA